MRLPLCTKDCAFIVDSLELDILITVLGYNFHKFAHSFLTNCKPILWLNVAWRTFYHASTVAYLGLECAYQPCKFGFFHSGNTVTTAVAVSYDIPGFYKQHSMGNAEPFLGEDYEKTFVNSRYVFCQMTRPLVSIECCLRAILYVPPHYRYL